MGAEASIRGTVARVVSIDLGPLWCRSCAASGSLSPLALGVQASMLGAIGGSVGYWVGYSFPLTSTHVFQVEKANFGSGSSLLR